jgi:Tol biopolymer transport system component
MRFTRPSTGKARAASLVLAVLAVALTGTAVTSAVAKPPSRTVGWITWTRNSAVKVRSGGRWHTLPVVAGRTGFRGRAVRALHAGDELLVQHRGDVEFRLDVDGNRAYCESLAPDSHLVVVPSKAALLRFVGGTSFCGVLPNNEMPMQLQSYGSITADVDPVFKVVVGKKDANVAVRKGALVVAGKGGRVRSVVLGRNRQTRVASGTEPTAPQSAAAPKAAEQKAVANVQQPLPPVNDGTPPKITRLSGPHDPSSLREATFEITASEPGTALTCALDSTDLRLCTSPQSYEHLRPGLHTFTVRATDAAGNIGPIATYRWEIDGSKIAFQTRRDGNFEVYTMNPDGTEVTNVTKNALDDERPAWSPDGRLLVFDSNRDRKGQLSDVWVMNGDGSNLTQLTHGPAFNGNASWSPDGKKIVFESTRTYSDEIYTMNADGSNQVQLTKDVAITTDANWSRNNRIVFASTISGNWQIYAINPDGSGRARLTDNKATEFGPAWSPDGSRIAFHSNRDGVFKIWVMNADGANPHAVTASSVDDYNPTWAPDGYEIAFQRQQDGDIYVMGLDTGKLRVLTDVSRGADGLAPDW